MSRFAIAAFAAALFATSASGQAVKNGTLSGTIVSANAVAPTGGSDAVLLTAPATGRLVITQICAQGTSGANNGDAAQVVGSTLGRFGLAIASGDVGEGACTNFSPGFAVPAGEELRCGQTGASGSPVSCSITGVLSKK